PCPTRQSRVGLEVDDLIHLDILGTTHAILLPKTDGCRRGAGLRRSFLSLRPAAGPDGALQRCSSKLFPGVASVFTGKTAACQEGEDRVRGCPLGTRVKARPYHNPGLIPWTAI